MSHVKVVGFRDERFGRAKWKLLQYQFKLLVQQVLGHVLWGLLWEAASLYLLRPLGRTLLHDHCWPRLCFKETTDFDLTDRPLIANGPNALRVPGVKLLQPLFWYREILSQKHWVQLVFHIIVCRIVCLELPACDHSFQLSEGARPACVILELIFVDMLKGLVQIMIVSGFVGRHRFNHSLPYSAVFNQSCEIVNR
jgi:hypothetical protein